MEKLISPQDMPAVDRILNEIRLCFPITESFDYEGKIRQIVHQHIWDVLANLQKKYEAEVDYVLDEMSRYAEKGAESEVENGKI